MRVSNNLSLCGLLLLVLLTGFCKYTHKHTHTQTMSVGTHTHTHTESDCRSAIKVHAASQYLFIYAFFCELELVSTAAGRLHWRLRHSGTH